MLKMVFELIIKKSNTILNWRIRFLMSRTAYMSSSELPDKFSAKRSDHIQFVTDTSLDKAGS